MSALLSLDQQIFLIINHLPHAAFLDGFMLLVSGVGTYGIIWLIVGGWLIVREERKDHQFWIPLLTGVVSAWFMAEIFLKNIFLRPRPSSAMGAIIVGLNCCGYAFPSGHATIAFAMAVIVSRKEPRWRWAFFLFAVLIAFSRVYLGKHYPLDVFAGAVLGILMGWLSLTLGSFVRPKSIR